MKRSRIGHLLLLVAVGSHVTQAIYYARMAVAMMENEDRAKAEPEPAAPPPLEF